LQLDLYYEFTAESTGAGILKHGQHLVKLWTRLSGYQFWLIV